MKYSEKELRLIRVISFHWYDIIINNKTDVSPPAIYDILALNMFIENRTGPEVDALRRAVTAIHDCTCYRNTPEWDELITF